MRLRHSQQGDTIIEVMVAFSVFALVAVGALTVMNQGTASAQNVLETSLVRQEVDNQAELLRFIHQAYIANPNDTTGGPSSKFSSILADALVNPLTAPTEFGASCTQTLPVGSAEKRFVLNSQGNKITNVQPSNSIDSSTTAPYAQVKGADSYGLWIEPVVSNAGQATSRYIDFHVRACWDSASGNTQRTLGTIIRLYVPENTANNTTSPVSGTIPLTTQTYFLIDGSQSTECFSHNAKESTNGSSLPSWAPFANLPAPQGVDRSGVGPCERSGKMIYNCSNYDARFAPNIPALSNGTYSIVLGYGDVDCGNAPIIDTYTFKGGIYVNGNATPRATFSLDSSSSNTISTSQKFNIGQLKAGDTIEIRWWNNQFYNGLQDPDFFIETIALNREGA